VVCRSAVSQAGWSAHFSFWRLYLAAPLERLGIALPGGQRRQPACGPQQPGGLGQADAGVDPVERRGRDDEIERPGVRQMLEGSHLEPGRRIRDVAPGSRNHRNADVDGGQVERPAGQLPGELARAAANLQHRSARADRGIRENGVDDLGG
jgi:hypothetical protein